MFAEGPYGLRNKRIDVRVLPGDIVFDVGSWIGDFAAYASTQCAVVYAFEPLSEMFACLEQTALLNSNIIPVQQGLGAEECMVNMSNKEYTLGNAIIQEGDVSKIRKQQVSITTIDDFVRKNKIERVDFIKADIEGYERYMLEGAQEVLRKFKPKLALCTYHLPDDPEILAALIKKANPEYYIVQKNKKLYAAIPEEKLCV